MAETLLFIVQAAAGELGLNVPSYVVGNTSDATTVQLLAHVNKVGRDLVEVNEWSALLAEPYVITTVANQELYPFPAGFDRIVGGTSWDRTNTWQLLGPDNPQVARYRRESLISVASPRRISRQEGGSLSLYPIDTAGGAVIVFDYVSRFWAVTFPSSGIPTPAYSIGVSDTDYCLFDTNLMIKGVKWSYMASKGMGSAAGLNTEWSELLKIRIAADMGGGETLSMIPLSRHNGNADVVAGSQPNAILSDGNASILWE